MALSNSFDKFHVVTLLRALGFARHQVLAANSMRCDDAFHPSGDSRFYTCKGTQGTKSCEPSSCVVGNNQPWASAIFKNCGENRLDPLKGSESTGRQVLGAPTFTVHPKSYGKFPGGLAVLDVDFSKDTSHPIRRLPSSVILEKFSRITSALSTRRSGRYKVSATVVPLRHQQHILLSQTFIAFVYIYSSLDLLLFDNLDSTCIILCSSNSPTSVLHPIHPPTSLLSQRFLSYQTTRPPLLRIFHQHHFYYLLLLSDITLIPAPPAVMKRPSPQSSRLYPLVDDIYDVVPLPFTLEIPTEHGQIGVPNTLRMIRQVGGRPPSFPDPVHTFTIPGQSLAEAQKFVDAMQATVLWSSQRVRGDRDNIVATPQSSKRGCPKKYHFRWDFKCPRSGTHKPVPNSRKSHTLSRNPLTYGMNTLNNRAGTHTSPPAQTRPTSYSPFNHFGNVSSSWSMVRLCSCLTAPTTRLTTDLFREGDNLACTPLSSVIPFPARGCLEPIEAILKWLRRSTGIIPCAIMSDCALAIKNAVNATYLDLGDQAPMHYWCHFHVMKAFKGRAKFYLQGRSGEAVTDFQQVLYDTQDPDGLLDQ
ncbi:hypothetical protein MJO28_011322 [Puccinia striiformis f. sp. tritici]|uniref:Uncharacterized protein n=1 Tax=Puccinia striiformis f. sp. tritici TaxID=168172 RepID=A0ACC0E3E2_9BASI|nr:hypothetical protein MJO28_011322 [Puccinia striiformis f. sp. tritici]